MSVLDAQTALRKRALYTGVLDGIQGPMFYQGMAQVAAGKPVPAGTGAALFTVLKRENMLTRFRACNFMSQIGHECQFQPVDEAMGYSAKRLTEVWPSRFPTIESAKPYEYQPAKLAEKVYGGRMGNKPGEAYANRGAGWLQHTGHDGLALIGYLGRRDELLTIPGAADGAVKYWIKKEINEVADLNDVRKVTLRVNGGTVGLEDRTLRLNRLLAIWQ